MTPTARRESGSAAAGGLRQTFAYVPDLPYTDAEGRTFHLAALEGSEKDRQESRFFV